MQRCWKIWGSGVGSRLLIWMGLCLFPRQNWVCLWEGMFLCIMCIISPHGNRTSTLSYVCRNYKTCQKIHQVAVLLVLLAMTVSYLCDVILHGYWYCCNVSSAGMCPRSQGPMPHVGQNLRCQGVAFVLGFDASVSWVSSTISGLNASCTFVDLLATATPVIGREFETFWRPFPQWCLE